MAKVNYGNSPSNEIPERLILDSSAGEVHPDMDGLLQKLEKAQGDTLAKIVTGLRGYSVGGFSFKVYAAPKYPTDNTTYELRIVFEYNAQVKSGTNLQRVIAAYMDVDPNREQPTLELPSVAKSGK